MATIKGTYVAGTGTVNPNTNIGFKLGLESALTSSSFTAQNGVFYLTSDTHRLFIGDKDGNVCPINQGVITVSSLPDSTGVIPGQFYYITGSNILATFNGTQWVHINPDTQVTKLEHAATASNNSATIKTTVTQEGGTHSNTSVVSNNVIIKGANDIVVTVDPATDTITLTDADYSFSTTGSETDVKFNLVRDPADGDAAVEDTVTFKGANGVDVTQNGKVITIDATDAMSTASQDSIASAAFSNRATNGFDLTLTRRSGQTVVADAHLDPVVKYGNTATEAHYNAGVATLSVYTIAEVDEKVKNALQNFNALTYKGTVGTGGTVTTLPTSQVQNGDVYMSNGYFTQDGTTMAAGTLFIAQGNEGTDGYLTSINWTHVENYNTDTITKVSTDADYTISFSNSVQDGANPGANTFLGSLKVSTQAGDPLTTTDTTVDKKKEIVISHNVSGYTHKGADASTGTKETVLFATNKVLGSLGVDDWGHVKTSEDVLIEVPTEVFTETETTATVAVDGTAHSLMTATFSDNLALKNADTQANITGIDIHSKIASETLVLAVNSGALKMDLMWGTF